MDFSQVLLVIFNMLIVAFLPILFFKRDGKLTFLWFLTALPYAVAPILLILQFNGYFHSWIQLTGFTALLIQCIALLLVLISTALIFLTLGTHRIPLALWHQNPNDDKPQQIVTWGAYKYIRHPFYTAFILAHAAFVLTSLHWSALVVFGYVFVLLHYTAKKEEQRLSTEVGELGVQYQTYYLKTNRFFPLKLRS